MIKRLSNCLHAKPVVWSSKLELALPVRQLRCPVQNHQDSKVFCDHWEMAPAMRSLGNGASYVTTGEWRWLCDHWGMVLEMVSKTF